MTTAWLNRLPYTLFLLLCVASTLSAQSISWNYVGRLEGGYIDWLAAIGPDEILAQTTDLRPSGQRFYRSTDAGASWRPFLHDSLNPALFLGGGNGHPLFLFRTGGNYRSTDGGASWEHLGMMVGQQTIHPTPSGALFVGSSGEIQRSLDGGMSWSKVAAVGIEKNASFATAPDGSIYAAFIHATGLSSSAAVGLWRSTDTGATWSHVESPDLPEDATAFAIAPSGTMFAIGHTSGVFRSTDRGAGWKRVLARTYTRGLRITSSQVMLSDEENIYFSSDDGATWNQRSSVVLYMSDALAVGSDVLVASRGRGVLKLGASSEPRQSNAGLDALGFATIRVRADGALLAEAGSTVYRSTDGGDHWTELEAGRGRAELSPMTTGGARLTFVKEQNGIVRSVDSGATWASVYNTTAMSPVKAIVAGPDHDAYALVAPDRLIRSTDDGATWLNFAFTEPATDGVPSNILVDGDRLLIGTGSGKAVEFDIATGIRRGEMMVNPVGVGELLRSPGGALFARHGTGGISRSTDNGLTWEKASPVEPLRHQFGQLVFGPGGRMAVSTDVGIFFSTDEGASWRLEVEGLPPLGSESDPLPLYWTAFGADGAVYAANTQGLYRAMLPTGAAVAGERTGGGIAIEPARPNPASDGASIHLRLDREARVSLRLADALGRDVVEARWLRLGAGPHDLPIDLSTVRSGIYFCTVSVGGVIETTRIVVAR